VEFARTIPVAIKGWKGESKHVLKEILRRHLPESLFIRPKHAFEVPVGHFFRQDGRDFLQHYLGREDVVKNGPFNFGSIKKLVHEHLNGDRDHGVMLYRLATFEHWREHYSVN
jgi:asparagine synthase (glutamine-hydrolysing)